MGVVLKPPLHDLVGLVNRLGKDHKTFVSKQKRIQIVGQLISIGTHSAPRKALDTETLTLGRERLPDKIHMLETVTTERHRFQGPVQSARVLAIAKIGKQNVICPGHIDKRHGIPQSLDFERLAHRRTRTAEHSIGVNPGFLPREIQAKQELLAGLSVITIVLKSVSRVHLLPALCKTWQAQQKKTQNYEKPTQEP